jgi:hypothetical protein
MHQYVSIEVKESVGVPVEHDPLRDSNDALLRLIQSRELGFHSIVGESHSEIQLSFLVGGF